MARFSSNLLGRFVFHSSQDGCLGRCTAAAGYEHTDIRSLTDRLFKMQEVTDKLTNWQRHLA